ncbi:hypothetical protein PspLS_05376 [Pyricularia sp. CBS 133598]|nr:hypothetical protein PspLS_05376 [Pyricularia sp. CBS 133598]
MDILLLKLSTYHSNEPYSDLTVVTEGNETFRLRRMVGIDGSFFRKITQFMYTGTYTEDEYTDLTPHPKALERVTPDDLKLQLATLGDFLGAAEKVGDVVGCEYPTSLSPEIICNLAISCWRKLQRYAMLGPEHAPGHMAY